LLREDGAKDDTQVMISETVSEQCAAIKCGQISEAELWNHYATRIAQLNPDIHALVDIAQTSSRHNWPPSSLPASPLEGIPIAIKANRDAAGLRTEHGSASLAGRTPTHDHPFVAKIRRAGASIIATSACSEFSLLPSCEPLTRHPVVNPIDSTRGTGGSSGGSAAAVAAGLVPLAHGNDAGGSLRIPAAACGVVSMATFSGTTEGAPLEAGEGFIATCVGDAIAAHQATHTLPTHLHAPPRHPRVGLVLTAPDGTRATPEMRTHLLAAARTLDDWSVDEADPLDEHPFVQHLFAALAPRSGDRIRTLLRTADADRIEPYTHDFLTNTRRVPQEHQRHALQHARDFSRHYNRHYRAFDVVISPLPLPPAPGVVNGERVMSELSSITGRLIAFTWPANIVRWPFVTVGSVQFASSPENFAAALAAARRYEAAGLRAEQSRV
jgi:amidase